MSFRKPFVVKIVEILYPSKAVGLISFDEAQSILEGPELSKTSFWTGGACPDFFGQGWARLLTPNFVNSFKSLLTERTRKC